MHHVAFAIESGIAKEIKEFPIRIVLVKNGSGIVIKGTIPLNPDTIPFVCMDYFQKFCTNPNWLVLEYPPAKSGCSIQVYQLPDGTMWLGCRNSCAYHKG